MDGPNIGVDPKRTNCSLALLTYKEQTRARLRINLGGLWAPPWFLVEWWAPTCTDLRHAKIHSQGILARVFFHL
jgi:hypothetical protein